tara:strand:- start:270 stop:467 length:198 start_codon:yes stop_codon:yes gene_type:complete
MPLFYVNLSLDELSQLLSDIFLKRLHFFRRQAEYPSSLHSFPNTPPPKREREFKERTRESRFVRF